MDKLTFVKGVPDWEWMVGTGVYLDDINDTIVAKRRRLREEVGKNGSSIIIIILFLESLAVLMELWVLKRIKNIIRYEESFYETLLNLSVDGIYIGNDRGEIQDCNKNIHKMLGYTRDELLNLSLTDLVVENQRKGSSKEAKAYKESRDKEVVIRKKDGTLLVAELSRSTLKIDEEVREVTFLRDITERGW